jgi:hypothetical protein
MSKFKIVGVMVLTAFAMGTVLVSDAGAQQKEMEKYNGFLFSKLTEIGSKSEGPTYFLQQFDYKEIKVIKKVPLWKEDPSLQKFLGKKVTIEGKMSNLGIVYEKIMDYKPTKEDTKKKGLNLDLKLGANILRVNKVPPGSEPSQSMALTLLVQWPYKSIWQGHCPTTQTYDFSIGHKGKVIWRWSDGKFFGQVVTPVRISGGDFQKFAEVAWPINPHEIQSEGTYEARALFIASGQEISKNFEIKFAQ